MSIGRSDRPFP